MDTKGPSIQLEEKQKNGVIYDHWLYLTFPQDFFRDVATHSKGEIFTQYQYDDHSKNDGSRNGTGIENVQTETQKKIKMDQQNKTTVNLATASAGVDFTDDHNFPAFE